MAIYFGEDIATKLGLADDYYAEGNHIRAYDWAQFGVNEQKAGLLQAEREINAYLGIDLELSFSSTSFPISACPNKRPDYSVFEHALFILDNTARTKTGTDGAQYIESDEYQEEEKNTGVTLSPQAQRFLGMNRIQSSRG
jgi:hypothetical protein